MKMDSTNSAGEHWIVDGKERNCWLLLDERTEDAGKFIRVYGDRALAQRVADTLNAA
jgi:hypothetical protein